MPDQNDPLSNFPGGIESPAENSYIIVPSDSANTSFTTRAVYVGGGGNLNVELESDAAGANTIFTAVPAGSTLPIRVRKVHSTSTTATAIIGLY